MKLKYPVFIFILACSVFACGPGPKNTQHNPSWSVSEQKAELIKKTGRKNSLEKILFLNDFYADYASIETDKKIIIRKYEYDLSGLVIVQGDFSRGKKDLKLSGEELVTYIIANNDLMRANDLDMLGMELFADCDINIKIYMVPVGQNRNNWLGNFILEKFVPFMGKKKARKVNFDLSQRFGLEEKQIARLTVKISPEDKEQVKVRLKKLWLCSHRVKLMEQIPSAGYFRYGGADRKRLNSVFLPVGGKLKYQISARSNVPVFLSGYLASVDNKNLEIILEVNDTPVLTENVSDKIRFFRREIIPEKEKLKLKIMVSGEAGSVAVLGNVSLYYPFSNRNNVVYYLTDALRADYGGIKEDLFAADFKDGAVFSHAYANATRTADSLPTIFSGKYKFTLVEKSEDVPFLSDKEVLLAEYFKSRGYATAAFINNPWLDLSNSTQGFDIINFCWNPVTENSYLPEEQVYDATKYGDMLALVRSFVEENSDKPLFLYIHTMEPHIPYETPPGRRRFSTETDPALLKDLYTRFTKFPHNPDLTDPSQKQLDAVNNLYRDAVIQAAHFFTVMREYLEKNGVLDEQSLLIFSADHGERFYEHGSWIHGPPDVYNEVVRVPLMLKGRGIKAGIYHENAQLIDIYPSVLDWFGDERGKLLHGTSLIELIRQGEQKYADRAIYIDGSGIIPQYAFIVGHTKVILKGDEVEIYDLSRDPGEMRNLTGQDEFIELVEEAKRFPDMFKRSIEKITRELTSEEKEKLRSLGYIR